MNNGLLNENGYKRQIFLFLGAVCIMILLISGVFLIFNYKGYLIVNESLILSKGFGRYKQINQLDDDVLKQKYFVYNDSLYKNVSLNYTNSNFYYLDSNFHDLDLKKVRVSYTEEFNKLKLANYSLSYYDDDDLKYISKVSGGLNLDLFKNSVMKYNYDLDSDGSDEVIYTMTNMSLTGQSGNFSTIFLVKDGNIVKFEDDTKSPYMVQEIIDIDNDGVYEIIVSKGVLNMPTFDSCYQIYNFKNNKISKVLDC